MEELLRIVSVEPVIHGVLKIVWTDDYQGIVDLRPTIARGRIFNYLKSPESFHRVMKDEYGHSIYWGEEGNEEVDFGCDRLRELAEDQARLIARADRRDEPV